MVILLPVGVERPVKSPVRSASVGTVPYWSKGDEERVPESVKKRKSFLSLVRIFGIYGADRKVRPKRFDSYEGCSMG